MRIIEIETKVEKNGVVRIPEAELMATGLKEGDDICLSYLEPIKDMTADEFILERRDDNNDVQQ